MSRSNKTRFATTLLTAGRIFYGAGIAGIGTQHLLYKTVLPVILPDWPTVLQSTTVAYIMGGLLLLCGVLIIINIQAKQAALFTGILLLVLFLAFQAPHQLFIVPYSFQLGAWTNALKELALAGGAFIIAANTTKHTVNAQPKLDWLIALRNTGILFFAVTMIAFGYDHFLYTDFVATLIPAWIPRPVFWTYFAGIALMAAGAAILFRLLHTVAAFLLAGMLLAWILVLHIPRTVDDFSGNKGNEMTSVYQAIAFMGIALLIGVGRPRMNTR